jgi:hypothetical protein
MAYVFRDPQQQALLAARQELRYWEQQHQFAEKRIPELRRIIETLSSVAANRQKASLSASLPELCLRVLSLARQQAHSVPQIRDGLRLMGVEVTGRNPLAVLHTTLGRLAQSGYALARSPRPGMPAHYRITVQGIQALMAAKGA